jgi:hypothetical protein
MVFGHGDVPHICASADSAVSVARGITGSMDQASFTAMGLLNTASSFLPIWDAAIVAVRISEIWRMVGKLCR